MRPDTNVLNIWVIYDHPLDFPDFFVARRHAIRHGRTYPTGDALTAAELEPLRHTLRTWGLVALMRDENDEKNIVESWL